MHICTAPLRTLIAASSYCAALQHTNSLSFVLLVQYGNDGRVVFVRATNTDISDYVQSVCFLFPGGQRVSVVVACSYRR